MARRYNYEIVFGVYLIDSAEKWKVQPFDEIQFHPRENISYSNLMRKLCYCFPIIEDVNFILTCVNEYYQRSRIQNTEDLHKAINMNYARNLYVVFNYEVDFIDMNATFPTQFFCHYCCFALVHFRFTCLECPQYNICARCKDNGVHSDHRLQYFDIINPQSDSYMEILEIRYSAVHMGRKLGEGGFGEVFMGHPINQPDIKWAIKRLKDCHGQQNSLIKEIKVFEQLGEHENVVKIEGYCRLQNEFLIVMEYVGLNINGLEITSLYDYLQYLNERERSNQSVNYAEIGSYFIQVARGMEHLETKKIVHRDLAARNILIDSRKCLKISDFGLAREEYYEGNTNNVCVMRWAAPEVLQCNYFSTKSDVWAFGVVCWEIATLGKVPYGSYSRKQIRKFVLNGNHLDKPDVVSPLFYERMCACWYYQPDERPDFFTLVSKITDFNWMSYY